MGGTDFRKLFERSLGKIAELKSNVAAHREPIAVIGIGCRFPGGASGPERLWSLLDAGVDAVTEVCPGRWPAGTLEHPGTRWAGLIDDVEGFDAAFFGIAPSEARSMDPQHRLLLEVAWETLEHANVVPATARATGVFAGLSTMDYLRRVSAGALNAIDDHAATGNAQSFAAGRVSHILGFEGPSLTVDTACSSSLVAVHLAAQSLRNSECDLALAGGVNLILAPAVMQMIAQTQALSPDGRCKTFDASANGFVRGEGCGLVALERLADAKAKGHTIWAVIRGSAVNQDGASTGLTAPNVLSQRALIRAALDRAGVRPEAIGYVETHGTGTSLGDPIEIDALTGALGAPRPDGAPCWLGALKANLGHLEAAAGVAGLIKAALVLDRERIPAQLHFEALNPRIQLDGTPFLIPRESQAWLRSEEPRLAGVSSFGLSGTNAHLVLEEGPAPAPREAAPGPGLLVLSAATQTALAQMASDYAAHLAAGPVDVAALCRTAAGARSHFPHRLAVQAQSPAQLEAALGAFAAGEDNPACKAATVDPGRDLPPAPEAQDSASLATLYLGGGDIASAFGSGRTVPLPTYPFERRRHWIAAEHAAPLPSPPKPLVQPIVEQLAALPLDRRRPVLRDALIRHAADVLGVDEEEVPLDQPLKEVGLDSLMAVDLRNIVTRMVGASLPSAVVFDHPTVDGLVEHLLADVLELAGPPSPSAAVAAPIAAGEPIAVVGIGCRFPGGVVDAASFWQLLISGVDAITEVPADRWDVGGLYDPDPDASGKMSTRWGGFLDDVDRFDAAFFDIAPKEALAMDPQQRILAEVCWEALEHAGMAPDGLGGTSSGVFVGMSSADYVGALLDGDLDRIDAYSGTGTAPSVAAGRIAYLLGLNGPVLTVDTACSSSLVAVHLACASLRDGEADMALAGGVNLVLTPDGTVYTSRLHAMAADGRCKPFDAAGDGYVRAEGCGVVVLKRLSDAQRDRDRVLAVIRGSALNHDGRSNGLTAPSGGAQEAVISRAVAQAGLTAADLAYVEAHGTGTALGDPIEMRALDAVGRGRVSPLLVGSVKSNIGHTEGAAGVAGLIKLVLSIGEGLVPPSLHFSRPNPRIPWDTACVKVPTEVTRWPGDGPRRGGVSAFGFSGSNVHAVVEAPPVIEPPASAPGPHLFLLSARTVAALDAQRDHLARWLEANPDAALSSVAHTLQTGRAHLDHRLAIVADDPQALCAALAEGGAAGQARRMPRVAFVFAGDAATSAGARQWRGWGVVPDVVAGRGEVAAAFAATMGLPLQALPALAGSTADPLAMASALEVDAAVVLGAAAPGGEQVLATLAALFVEGVDVDWRAVAGPRDGPPMALPTYPWQRQRFWPESPSRRLLAAGDTALEHPLLHRRLPAPGQEVQLVAVVSTQHQRYLADHQVYGRTVVPGAFHLALFLAAGELETGNQACELRDVVFPQALTLTQSTELHVVLAEAAGGARLLSVSSRAGDRWARHATAKLTAAPRAAEPARSLAEARRSCPDDADVLALYRALNAIGVRLGPAFQRISALSLGAGQALARVEVAPDDPDGLHPARIDALFQAVMGAVGAAASDTAYVPFRIDALRLHGEATGTLWCHAVLPDGFEPGAQRARADLWVFDDSGRLVIDVDGLHLERASARALLEAPAGGGEWQHVLRWKSAAPLTPDEAPGGWQVVGAPDVAAALASEPVAPAEHFVYVADVAQSSLHLCSDVLALVQEIVRSQPAPRLTLITTGAQAVAEQGRPVACAHSTLWGLARVVRLEHPDLRCRLIDVDPDRPIDSAALRREVASGDEEQVALRDGRRYVARVVQGLSTDDALVAPGSAYHRLAITSRGSLDQLALVESIRRAPGPGEVEIAVEAAGLNFRDVLNALGMYPGDAGALGLECVGIVVAAGGGVTRADVGDRVMGIAGACFGHFTTVDQARIARVPAGLYPAEAATLPIAFMTAWHGLRTLADIGPDDRVLIHAAAGGVGMAAVQLALHAGAEVFATASPSKWHHLQALGVRHVMSSRNLDFVEEVRAATGGRGVSVVLNSLAGPFIEASLALLETGGRFIEIGKTDVWSASQVAERFADLRYLPFDLGTLAPERMAAHLDAIAEAVGSGEILPLPHRVFGLSRAKAAFRTMSAAKHVGKLVLVPDRRGPVGDGSYLITGGLGALGLQVAAGLADRGARRLVLVGRRPPNEAARRAVQELVARGLAVDVVQGDVSRADDVQAVLSRIADSGAPLRGVVHAAGLLDDGLLTELDADRFAAVLAPKVDGAWNLHCATRALPLDFFVLFSSAASLLGSPGQGSYAAANAFLDGLAHHRRALGLAALSVGWGPWAGRGMAAGLKQDALAVMAPQRCVDLLFALLMQEAPHVGVFGLDLRSPRVERLLGRSQVLQALANRPKETRAQGGLTDRLRSVPEAARQAYLRNVVREHASEVLGLDDFETLMTDAPLADQGLDSLMAVDLRNALADLAQLPLPASLVFDLPTVDAIADDLRTRLDPGGAPALEAPRLASAAADVPIAVVGIGCRFPGGVRDADGFWQLLIDGVDAIEEVPPDRWDAAAYYDPDPDAPGKMTTRWGGFLDDVDRFDADFFSIAPREAQAMDPQQRMLLEVTWEALEDAGVPPVDLSGSATGVFVGVCANDYAKRLGAVDGYTGTGNALSVVAGRISYALGLQGPSMAIDTACSSSLVAVHLACQSLQAGDCSLAVAAGVNLVLSPDNTIYFSKIRAMAADGRSKPFDASADGYVRSDGCGVVVLAPLPEAEAAGLNVLAVIRGSAVNQDGRSNGLTAPSGPAQEVVLRGALARAGLTAGDVGYIEAHGTGTPLGDPLEMKAIGAVFGGAERPLWVGSVKSNVGHTEGAAGVAGLIKAVLAVDRGAVPASLHFRTPSPHIPFAELGVAVPTATVPWPAPRVAGVSAFGFSGTNAHVIVGQPAARAEPQGELTLPLLLPLSGRRAGALGALVDRTSRALGTAAAQDVVYGMAVRRSHHSHRAAFIGDDGEQLAQALAAYREDCSHPDVVTATRVAHQSPKIAFVFSGQGSQWQGMGRELYDAEPVFRDAFDACATAVARCVGWALTETLDRPLEGISHVQPAIFAVQVALAALWRSWGVVPDAVVGHSMGEAAAAYVAGALSLDDAAAIICRRSALLERISGEGAMAVVELSMQAAAEAIAEVSDRLSVAVSNGPRSTVLSGDPAALEAVVERLSADGVFCRLVKVDVASHSPQVDPLLADLRDALDDLTPRQATVPMYSTVHLDPMDGSGLDAAYWVDNLRAPVRFGAAVERLAGDGHGLFVEVSPHPILLSAVAEVAGDAACVGSLRRDAPAGRSMRRALAQAYVGGAAVAWSQLYPQRRRHVRLPRQPWADDRHWAVGRRSEQVYAHPLIGPPITSSIAPGQRLFERRLSVADLPYVTDHRVLDAVVFPGAGYLEMLAQAHWGHAVVLDQVRFEQPLAFGDGADLTLQLVLTDDDRWVLSSRAEGQDGWVRHADGLVRVIGEAPGSGAELRAQGADEPASFDFEAIQGRCVEADPEQWYGRWAEGGLAYGPTFRGVVKLWIGDGEALARVVLPQAAVSHGYRFHPAVLDAAMHVGAVCAAGELAMPVAIASAHLGSAPAPRALWSYARLDDDRTTVRLLDDHGVTLASLRGIQALPLRVVAPTSIRRYLTEAWPAATLPRSDRLAPTGRWCLVGTDRLLPTLAHGLTARGQQVCHVPRLDSGAPPWTEEAPIGVVIAEAAVGADAGVALAAQVVDLVQALVGPNWRDPPRLWLLTRGAQSADGPPEARAIGQAGLWGLGATIAHEHPELRCCRVDLSVEPSTAEEAQLVDELLANVAEDQLAFRGERRLVRRLDRVRVERRAPVAIRADGTYLITGGLGGLGLTVAQWLVDRGARHLVLCGRSGAASRAQRAAVSALGAGGATVAVAAVDVCDRQALAAVLADLQAPLRGVVHAAGVLADSMLLNERAERLRRVMAPKVLGAENLDALTADCELDFFVLYGSAVSLLGAPAQGGYAAANAYLDALARHRAGRGLPGLSIAWGVFAEVGLAAASADRGARLAGRGLRGLTPAEGLEILEELLGADAVQVGAVPLDARQWLELHPQAAHWPYLEALVRDAETGYGRAGQGASGAFAYSLLAKGAEQRIEAMQAFLREQVAHVLRTEPARVELRAPLQNLGLDSLMGLELRNRLEWGLGLTLSATLVWTHPHVAALAAHLLGKLEQGAAEAPAPVSAQEADDRRRLETIAAMPEEDKERLLEARLQALEGAAE